jgi:hypothetical protein
MTDHDPLIRAFREAPEWNRLRAHWERRAPVAAIAAGVTVEEWIASVQDALLCFARCVAARADGELASVLPVIRDGFFSRDPEFHRRFGRFARRWSELSRRYGKEAETLLVEETVRRAFE